MIKTVDADRKKIVSILGLLILFFFNITGTVNNIFIQIVVYFIFFVIAVSPIFLTGKTSLKNLIFLLFGFYFVFFSATVQNWSGRDIVINFGYITLWIWVMIVFEKKNFSDRDISFIAVFVILMCIYMIFNFDNRRGVGDYGFINNNYYALAAFPFLLLVKNKSLKIISISIACTTVLYSLKRTSIIALLVILICYILYNVDIKKFSLKPILLIAFVVSVYIMQEKIVQLIGIDFFSRFYSDSFSGGNGRIDIYKSAFDIIKNSNVLKLFFGSGYNALINYYGKAISAHNDFLEIFIDYGIVGFLFYIHVLAHYFKVCLYHIKHKTIYGFSCLVSLCVFIIVSTLGHCVIYPSYFMLILMFWSFVESERNYATNR